MALPKKPMFNIKSEDHPEPQRASAEDVEAFYADESLLPSDLIEVSETDNEGHETTYLLDAPELAGSSPASSESVPVRPAKRLEQFNQMLEDGLSNLDPQLLEKTKPGLQRTEPVLTEEVPKARRTLQRFGGITADFAVNGDYKLYKHLEPHIRDMVVHIQETLSELGRSDTVGKARRNRNTDFFYQTYEEIDRLITRALASKNSPVQVEPRDQEYFTAAVVNDIMGFGPLEPLWQDPTITEVMVNGPYEIRVEIGGKTRIATGIKFRDQDHAMRVADSFLALAGRSMTTKMPYADSTLPDGSRLNATHPEISPDGPYLTIRRFPDTSFSMRKLVELGSMDPEMATIIGNLVYHGVSAVIAGGTGTGKALAVDTLIPTPEGFVRLDSLREGSYVFGADGKPAPVTGYFPQPSGRNCYKVTFSDGEQISADADHNWFVNDEVKTTAELLTMIEDTTLRVPLTHPVQYEEQDLPVDPYLFGFWAACPNDDALIPRKNAHLEEYLTERGIEFTRLSFSDGNEPHPMLRVNVLEDMLSEYALDSENCFIPDAYLRGSTEQRTALLNGLMDNGGILHRRSGLVEFILSDNSSLADQIGELISSLGIPMRRQEAQYYNSVMDVLVMECDDEIFLCPELQKAHADSRKPSRKFKTIESIEPIPSVEVACISVDSPGNLYLFGNSYTVTHNTSMLNALSGCIPEDQRIITVEDTLELQLNPNKQVLRLRSRPASPSGEDAVTIRDLVRNTLRQRPDRIVVGEVRDSSAYDMLQAMSTGHDGSLTTTHASSPEGTIERLSLLVSEAGEVTPERAMSLIASAVDVIVNIDRYPEDGSRRVASISEVPSKIDMEDGRMVLNPIPLWEWVRDGYDKDTGKLTGHYEKVNEMSDSLRRKHALDVRRKLSLEEILEISDIEDVKPAS